MVTVATPAAQHVTIDGAGHWLAPAPAASYQQMRAAGMPDGGITSAGRTSGQQASLYANRGSNPYPVAAPGTSKHELGEALDVSLTSSTAAWLRANGARYGWTRPLASDPVHWEYASTSNVTTVSNPISGGLDAVKTLAGDAVSGVANFLGFGDIENQVFTIVITGAFVIAGLALGVLGLSKMLAPEVARQAQPITSALGGAS